MHACKSYILTCQIYKSIIQQETAVNYKTMNYLNVLDGVDYMNISLDVCYMWVFCENYRKSQFIGA